MSSKNTKLSSIIKTSLLCLSLAPASAVHANAAKQQKEAPPPRTQHTQLTFPPALQTPSTAFLAVPYTPR